MDEELIKSYSDFLKSASETPAVRQLSRYYLRFLLRYLSSKQLSISDLNAAIANDYLYCIKSAGHSIHTLQSAVYHLRLFSVHAIHYGFITMDPTKDLSLHWLEVPGGYPAYKGALREIFDRAAEAFVYRLPRFAPYWELYLRHLLDQKYDIESIRQICGDNRAFHDWIIDRKMALTDVTPSFLEGYIRHRHSDFKKKTDSLLAPQTAAYIQNSIRGFLTFVFRQQNRHFQKPKEIPDSKFLRNKLLEDYIAFCRDHQGLKEVTLKERHKKLLRFRAFLKRHGIRLRNVNIKTIDDFFVGLSHRMNVRTLGAFITTCRSFFRFLYLHGKYRTDLARDMVLPCRFSRDTRPKYVPWNKIQGFLDSIDRSSPQGKRDFAIAAIFAHHGFRPKEVASLQLTDIDWKESSAFLQDRKNNTNVKFPLSPVVLAALRDYLAVRPITSLTHIFLSMKAPLRSLQPAFFTVVFTCGLLSALLISRRNH